MFKMLLLTVRCVVSNQIAAASEVALWKSNWNSCLGFILIVSTEQVELITHLSFDTFFSARADLLKDIFENESTRSF